MALATATNTDFPPANLTGPCLITYCVGSTVNPPNKYCQLSLNTCTAQSRNFTDVINNTNTERCSYMSVVQIAAEYQMCNIQELAGTISGAGTTWSLFDAVSTLQVDYRADVSSSPILSVQTSTLSAFQHFFTEGAAVSSGNAGAASTSSQGGVTLPTASTGASATSTSTCTSGSLCESMLGSMSITSGTPATATATGTSASATTTKKSDAVGQKMPSIRLLFVLGTLGVLYMSAS